MLHGVRMQWAPARAMLAPHLSCLLVSCMMCVRLFALLPCRRVVAEHKPKIVFLTSPNNPDGSTITEQDLLEVLALPVLVVLDEAYIEFCTDVPSRLDWVQKYNNLVVLRTFSKCAALAGMRVGYGAFPLGMIEYLWRAKQPYNVSVAAEVR
jgi:histidinol-phosphate aminotransferase